MSRSWIKRVVAVVIALAVSSLSGLARGQDSGPLVVHEWGTFTSLQDETGRALGAINQDTEALPDFVRNLMGADRPATIFGKGVPISPAVTMRLETPVVYFHPPKGAAPFEVDFSVEFRGGLLTQFYPDASAEAVSEPIKINDRTVGRLEWRDVTLGTGKPGPATTSRVWLAPRQVDAADLTASNGDNERYLFYRGVGHIDSPLRVVQGSDGRLRMIDATHQVQDVWYFDVRPDGKAAFRNVGVSHRYTSSNIVTDAAFAPADYRDDAVAGLRAQMKPALVKAGLFEDEAEAMLNTWEEAYFKSPGTRVFYVVPRQWVDERLPIKLSVPAKIERVMVGRIDLVTPAHRRLAQQYVREPDKNSPQAQNILKQLGRFAQPIVNDEVTRPQARAE